MIDTRGIHSACAGGFLLAAVLLQLHANASGFEPGWCSTAKALACLCLGALSRRNESPFCSAAYGGTAAVESRQTQLSSNTAEMLGNPHALLA